MMILQRWEPIISETFPSRITFWINIHGVPLHYWNEGAIEAIGSALGPIVDRDVDKARLRVQVNGLEPLIMRMDIQLPSREVVEIELEYEQLQKHCFHCKSLSHEDDDCPMRPARQQREHIQLGISQQNTLAKIEEDKRRQENRKQARQHHSSHREGAKWPNYKGPDNKATPSLSRHSSLHSSDFEENRRRYDDRSLSRHISPPSRRSPSHHRPSYSRDSRDSRHPKNRASPALRDQVYLPDTS